MHPVQAANVDVAPKGSGYCPSVSFDLDLRKIEIRSCIFHTMSCDVHVQFLIVILSVSDWRVHGGEKPGVLYSDQASLTGDATIVSVKGYEESGNID